MNGPEILPGFTRWNFNLLANMYLGFGWCGLLQMLYHGKTIVVGAYGFPKGDHGDFRFHICCDHNTGYKYSQDEADQMQVIAFKTERPSDKHPAPTTPLQ